MNHQRHATPPGSPDFQPGPPPWAIAVIFAVVFLIGLVADACRVRR